MNNKSFDGYRHVFIDLLEAIESYEKLIKNNLKWVSYTSDFETALIKAFSQIFTINKYNIIHYGCYFHFLKNCRKKLLESGYGRKEKENIYKKIMNFTSELPFTKNIKSNYKKIINKFFGKLKEEQFFSEYITSTWGKYFSDGSLNLLGVKSIFRTNNSLKNYNRIFKNLPNMKPNMVFSLYVDNIKNEFVNYKIMILDNENKNQKKISNIKKTKKYIDNSDSEDFDIDNMLNQLDINDKLGFKETDNNIPNNEIIKPNSEYINCNNNKVNWFVNDKLSCAYDSFYSIFINNLYFNIKDLDYKSEQNYTDDFNLYLFYQIFNFIENLLQNDINNKFSFYSFYKNYIADNNLVNFLLILGNEINNFIPITTVFRPYYNNNFFNIKYKKVSKCNGRCKFQNDYVEILNSPPFIEITLNNLNNKFNKTVDDILKNEIYESKTKFCDS